jgi:hypothetical protein
LHRGSKVQVSKIVFYWALLTVIFSIIWTVFLNSLRFAGMGAAISLLVPIVMGGAVAAGLYWLRDYKTLEYDDRGYRFVKRSGALEGHTWSQFQECSIVRDNYGRQKVRAYEERDARHVDIDTLACGVDAYTFRDFAAAQIGSKILNVQSALHSGVFRGLEEEIHRGRASWIADLSETFRLYNISGEHFALVARGNTRPRGFLLSRFLAMTVLPNYNVCLYSSELRPHGEDARSQVMKLIRIIETQRDQKDIKWSWLLLISEDDPPVQVSRFIETFGNKEVGIGCINISSGKITTSPNHLGRSLSNQMRLGRLISDLRKKRFISASVGG